MSTEAGSLSLRPTELIESGSQGSLSLSGCYAYELFKGPPWTRNPNIGHQPLRADSLTHSGMLSMYCGRDRYLNSSSEASGSHISSLSPLFLICKMGLRRHYMQLCLCRRQAEFPPHTHKHHFLTSCWKGCLDSGEELPRSQWDWTYSSQEQESRGVHTAMH